jgi:predicted component of type VI protein secretion system
MSKLHEFLHPLENEDMYLIFDPVYDQIRYARHQDDDSLSQGVWVKELKKSQWDEVEKLCSFVLKERSKDLQVAVWLWEAWTNLYEDGVIEGGHLVFQLLNQFDVHPHDKIHRKNILEWADRTISSYVQHSKISLSALTPLLQNLSIYDSFVNLHEVEDTLKQKDEKYENHKPCEPQQPVQSVQENPPPETITEDVAFDIISQIKDFLKQKQPHSMTPLLLEMALSWKSKTIVEILEEIHAGTSCHQKLMEFLYKTKN